MFPPAVQYTPVSKLSGGERRRLDLALVLMEAPNILLLDEPTNDLDIPTLAALEEYLDTFEGVLIVVSHDRWFLDRTIDHILRFEGAGHVREYPGDYSAFLEIKQREEASEAEGSSSAPKSGKAKRTSNKNEASKKLSYKEKQELSKVEKRIERGEERKAEIEDALSQNAVDFDTISGLSEELGELNSQLELDMDRWAELADKENG